MHHSKNTSWTRITPSYSIFCKLKAPTTQLLPRPLKDKARGRFGGKERQRNAGGNEHGEKGRTKGGRELSLSYISLGCHQFWRAEESTEMQPC